MQNGNVLPGTSHWGTADHATLLVRFPQTFSARTSSLGHGTECIKVNKKIDI